MASTALQPVEPPVLRDSGCPLCGSASRHVLYPVDVEYAERIAGVRFERAPPAVAGCRDCGHQYIHPVPDDAFLGAYYSHYMDDAKTNLYRDRVAVEIPASFRQRYDRWIDVMVGLNPAGRSLLDVGAGVGMFLRLAREKGLSVEGIEPSAQAVATLTTVYGIEAANCRLESFEAAGKYDFVTMWDLLEHLPDPAAALEKVARFLAPGGILVIETPVRDSVLHWAAKAAYRLSLGRVRRPLFLVYGVHHLQYFSTTSLAQLLRSAGYSVVKTLSAQTELAPQLHAVSLPVKRAVKAVAFNAAIASLMMLGRLSARQNKIVVFARLGDAAPAQTA